MFNVFRNKLPRLAATQLTAQAPQWSERASSGSDSDDDSELPTSSFAPFSTTKQSHTADRPYLRIGDRADGRALLNSRNPHSWQDKDKKRHQLMSAANYLRHQGGGMDHVLVMNLGDPWTDPSQLQLFDNRVIDIPIAKQTAPGSDLIPLDILFTICSSMHSWLRINDKNVMFLHANNQAGGSGETSLKFVVGCFMAYLGDSDLTSPNPTSPAEQKTKESHWKVNNKAFGTPQEPDSEVSQVMYSVGIDTNKINSYGGPARKRYANYFLSILYTPNPPPSQDTPLAVDHVIISGLDEIKTNLRVTRLLSQRWKDSLLHPVLVIYQKGKLKWKGVVPIKDSRVEVSPEVSVRGDCVVGLWFVKDCISTNDPPVVAFSFNSAFMEAGVVRLSSGDLSCLGMDMCQVLDNPACNVTMELTLTYGESSDEEDEPPEMQNMSFSDYRNTWLAQRGGLPSIYATVQDSQKKEAPSRRLRPPMPEPAPMKDDHIMKPDVELPIVKPVPGKTDKEEQEIPTEAPKTPIASESSIPRHPHKQQTGVEEGLKEASTSDQKAEEKKAVTPKKKAPARAPGPPPPPPPPPRTKLRRTPSGNPIPAQKSRPVSKTKSFFWDITPKQSGTLWSELTQGELEPSHLAMLENLFCHDDQIKSKEGDKGAMSSTKKSGTALALSVGRANNVSIMMTRFKHFSGIDEICRGVLTGEGLTDEELYLLAQICPTEGEIKELSEHKEEDLSVPEKILVGMTCVPRLRVKAACQLATRNWEKHFSEAIDMLETIRSACHQIKESKRLQRVFAAILSVGNTMNRGTSRGNAGCIKIESLSRLWDTRVSGSASNQKSVSTPAPLQRSGSVPTAISQALEGPKVEEKIVTLLDFTAVIVHDKDLSSGCGAKPNGPYLLLELESLSDAVQYLEDGVSELLSEVDHGFELLEKEFRNMTGKSWSSIESTTLSEIKIRNCESFTEEQRGFLKKSHQFLIEAGGARNFLKQEQSVIEQHLKTAVQWLGESSNENPKLHLKRLLEFAKRFDQSYNQLKPCLTSISE